MSLPFTGVTATNQINGENGQINPSVFREQSYGVITGDLVHFAPSPTNSIYPQGWILLFCGLNSYLIWHLSPG
jgi:hypothetical protein